MVETASTSHDRQESSVKTFDKDVEAQMAQSDSETEIEMERESSERGDRVIEAYRVPSNGLYAGKETPVTRTSTKSSWKDPGPPPDGGWGAWTQGMYIIPHTVEMHISNTNLLLLTLDKISSKVMSN